MTRSEIEALAFKRLTTTGYALFHAAVQRGRLEPTAGVSGAVCRLWIDWLQADGGAVEAVRERLSDLIVDIEGHMRAGTHPASPEWQQGYRVGLMRARSEALGRPYLVSEASDDGAARDVDNETDRKTAYTGDGRPFLSIEE